ncbi:YhcN/YlaJ family sporulation lipoprotein [Bacillus pumilus]
MKKQLTAAILLSMLLGGCGFQSGMNRQVDEDSSSKTIRLSDRHEGNNSNMPEADTNRAGYVRYQRQQVTDQKERTPALNREHLAHVITSLTVQLPNIKDAATLVTDEDALIVYRTGNKNRDESADQVKKTAVSVLPRYYHVYVSDNPEYFQSIANFSRLQTNSRDFDQILTKTIQQMKYSPQGGDISTKEDANGMTNSDRTMRRNAPYGQN